MHATDFFPSGLDSDSSFQQLSLLAEGKRCLSLDLHQKDHATGPKEAPEVERGNILIPLKADYLYNPRGVPEMMYSLFKVLRLYHHKRYLQG